MSSRFRLLSFGVLALLLLALPASGLAADPHSGSGSSALPSSSHGPQVALAVPAVVPGASVLTLGYGDLSAWSSASGGSVVGVGAGGGYFWYGTGSASEVDMSLRLPAGATIWQIDGYGYLTGTGTQTWKLLDSDAPGGGTESTVMTATSPSGTGVTQATMTFPSGATLAVGHHLYLDVEPTSSSAGAVGAVVQYTVPTLSFVPITPVRLLDSRTGNGMPGGTAARLRANTPFTFQITGRGGVPAYAKAVTGNLTVTDQTSAWAVYLGPNATASPTSSTINFVAGEVIANGVTVALSPTGTLSATYISTSGQTTHLVFDVTGYYQ